MLQIATPPEGGSIISGRPREASCLVYLLDFCRVGSRSWANQKDPVSGTERQQAIPGGGGREVSHGSRVSSRRELRENSRRGGSQEQSEGMAEI